MPQYETGDSTGNGTHYGEGRGDRGLFEDGFGSGDGSGDWYGGGEGSWSGVGKGFKDIRPQLELNMINKAAKQNLLPLIQVSGLEFKTSKFRLEQLLKGGTV